MDQANWKQKPQKDDIEATRQMGAEPVEEEMPGDAETATDYAQSAYDPTINPKQFRNDVEFIRNRGPLGSGD